MLRLDRSAVPGESGLVNGEDPSEISLRSGAEVIEAARRRFERRVFGEIWSAEGYGLKGATFLRGGTRKS